ncbi:formyl peptide receptor 2-like [Emydura macquarii macquarii]|uniref:formyl peptide receptor 2-like n=1 Tax=Emydura macquarii macquarii TaxID=1129001 RepID=UPI00352ADF8D
MVFLIPFLVPCVLSFLAGVLLNGYVLFITGFRVERTVSAMWFLNRAVADFIIVVFLLLGFTAIYLFDSEWAERLSSTIISVHLFSSAFLLTALSVYRCILVALPTWAQNHCTPQLAGWVVLGMWALSLGFGLRYGGLWESLLPPGRIRARFQLDEERLKAAVAIQFLVGFLIPLAFILIPTFYILLAAKLRRNRLSQSNKPLWVLLFLILNFLICWLPYHILCFLLVSATYPPSLWMIGSNFASVLTYFTSCLNPIFYLTMEDEFLSYWQRTRNPQTAYNSGPEPAE